jgi:hypothetical protein
MSLLDVLRAGIKTADDVTKPLQATVMYSRCTGEDAYGELLYAAGAVPLRAIVEWKQQQVMTQGGTLVSSRVSVLFLDVAALATASAGAGVTTKDKIVLPAGETGTIINLDGFLDAGTGQPVATTAYLE